MPLPSAIRLKTIDGKSEALGAFDGKAAPVPTRSTKR